MCINLSGTILKMARRGGITIGVFPVDALHAPHEYDKFLSGDDTAALVFDRETRQLRLISIENDGNILKNSDVITMVSEQLGPNDTMLGVQISTPVVDTMVIYSMNAPRQIKVKCLTVKYVKLLKGVKIIRDGAFRFLRDLNRIIIPSSVNFIGRYAFEDCKNLTYIEIPPIQNIPSEMLSHCNKLITVKLSNGIQGIKEEAFTHCDKLQNINIPPSVKYINRRAFYGCNKLKVIRLRSGLKTIESEAFLSCYSLKVFVIPATVESIGEYAFLYCPLAYIVNLSTVKLNVDYHMLDDNCKILTSLDELYNQAPELYHLYFPELRARFYTAVGLRENRMPNELSTLIMGMSFAFYGEMESSLYDELASVQPDYKRMWRDALCPYCKNGATEITVSHFSLMMVFGNAVAAAIEWLRSHDPRFRVSDILLVLTCCHTGDDGTEDSGKRTSKREPGYVIDWS